MFVTEVYGLNTQLDFEKINKKQEKEIARKITATVASENEVNNVVNTPNPSLQPSSCVSSMSAVENPRLSQQDLNIDDVLNSKMTNTAMKLFQSPNSPRIKSKL